jgi:perosamine synthetase
MKAASVPELIAATRRALGDPHETVALHEPAFEGNEWAYVKECLDTGWVSSVGKYVDRFERDLCEYTGSLAAIGVVNGTAALEICCKLVGVRDGDEVLVPTLTFVATANAVHHAGGTPHLVDCEDATLGVDPVKLADHLGRIAEVTADGCRNRETGRVIRALIVVHIYGHAARIEELAELCAAYRIELIEDAAESLGSFFKGKSLGTYGRVASLSFNGNKIITTGGGGAVLTQDAALGARAKHLTTTARQRHAWEITHDEVGYNYRLPNLNAALGCAQLELLPRFVEEKRELAARYFAAFAQVGSGRLLREPAGARSNYWLNTWIYDRADRALRDEFLDGANAAGLQIRPTWVLMHELPMYRACPRMDLSVAEDIERRLINLPSSARWGRPPGATA